MTLGVVLGLGVALTYAASLGGILPVLQVVVERESLKSSLLRAASENADKWYAGWLGRAAEFFPATDTPADRMRTLVILVGLLIAANIAGNVLRCFSQYLILRASQRTVMDLRRKMYRKALHLPMTDLAGDVSSTVSRFQADVREVLLGIVTLFGKAAREPLKAVCVFVVALAIDARLTLVVLAIAPPAVGLLWYFGRKVRKATVRLLAGYGRMVVALEESLRGVEVVKSYSQQGHERRRMWQLERGMLRQQLKLDWIEAVSSPLIEVIGIVAASAGIVWLASRTFAPPSDPGHIAAAQFITMVILLSAMLDPIRKVASVYNAVQRAGAAATRLFQFLDQPEERSPAGARALSGGAARAVRFEQLSFRYTPEAAEALRDVSLTVRPGECIALVGPNGSGKTTLMRMLPRLLDPQAGRVMIDGLDLGELSLRSLRDQIAVVGQRPVIFARTARENIAYGGGHVSPERLHEAARQAHAAEFIESWPEQYETILGEAGANLSGGERQRIAIARAFLKPATILIFDEATSEVDAESERRIHDALLTLRRGKTTFLIAHRHTVMDLAERIVVMDAGRIVDVGTREQLLGRCPLFVALYRSPEV